MRMRVFVGKERLPDKGLQPSKQFDIWKRFRLVDKTFYYVLKT